MNRQRLKFLKTLKKYGILTSPELCKILKVAKRNTSDYARLIEYIGYPSERDDGFEEMFTIEHFEDDRATSCKSQFMLTEKGNEYLERKANKTFTIATTIITVVIATITLIMSFI
ncbi:MAG: hypothetical protein IKW08_09815 [Roseburia sp.]|nr:hypothetical protein [Roseburia sp.]